MKPYGVPRKRIYWCCLRCETPAASFARNTGIAIKIGHRCGRTGQHGVLRTDKKRLMRRMFKRRARAAAKRECR